MTKFEKWFRENVQDSGYEEYCMDFYAGQFAHHIEKAFESQQKKIDHLKELLEKNALFLCVAIEEHHKESRHPHNVHLSDATRAQRYAIKHAIKELK